MLHVPQRPSLLTRRQLIRTVGTGILAAPALILTAQQAAVASNLVQQVMCPEVSCGYRYNPSIGDPDHGIPPGTPFEDLPDDWECPECGTLLRHW